MIPNHAPQEKQIRIQKALLGMQTYRESITYVNDYIKEEDDIDVLRAIVGSDQVKDFMLAAVAENFSVDDELLSNIIAKTNEAYVLEAAAKNPNANNTLNLIMGRVENTGRDMRTLVAITRNQNASPEILDIVMTFEEILTCPAIAVALAEHRNIDLAVKSAEFIAAFVNLANDRWASKWILLEILRVTNTQPNFNIPTEAASDLFRAIIKTILRQAIDIRITEQRPEFEQEAIEILTAMAGHRSMTSETFKEIMGATKVNDTILAAFVSNHKFENDPAILKTIATNPQADTETLKAIIKKTKNLDAIKVVIANPRTTPEMLISIADTSYNKKLQTPANLIKELNVLLVIAQQQTPMVDLQTLIHVLSAASTAYTNIHFEDALNVEARNKTIDIFRAITEHASISKLADGVDRIHIDNMLADIAGRFIVSFGPEILKLIVANPNASASTLKRVAMHLNDSVVGNSNVKSLLREIAEDPRSEATTLAAVVYMTKDLDTLDAAKKHTNFDENMTVPAQYPRLNTLK